MRQALSRQCFALLLSLFVATPGQAPAETLRVWLMETGVPIEGEIGRERIDAFRRRYADLLWLTDADERALNRLSPRARMLLAQEPLLEDVQRALTSESYNDITLRIRFRSWREIHRFESEIDASLTSREPVHLVELGTSHADELFGRNERLFVSFRDSDFPPHAFEDVLIGTPWATILYHCPAGGFIRGVPRQLDARLLWYWPSHFRDQGAAVRHASTFRQLRDALTEQHDPAEGRIAFGMVRDDQNAFNTLSALSAAFGVQKGEFEFSRPLGFLRSLAIASKLRFVDDEEMLQHGFNAGDLSAVISGPWVLQYARNTPGDGPQARLLPGDMEKTSVIDATKGTLLCQTRIVVRPETSAKAAVLLSRARGPAWSAAAPVSDHLPEPLRVLGRLYRGESNESITLSANVFGATGASRMDLERGRQARRLGHFLQRIEDPEYALRLDPARWNDPTPLEKATPWVLGGMCTALMGLAAVLFGWWRRRVRRSLVGATCCILTENGSHRGLGTIVRLPAAKGLQRVLVTCEHVIRPPSVAKHARAVDTLRLSPWQTEPFAACWKTDGRNEVWRSRLVCSRPDLDVAILEVDDIHATTKGVRTGCRRRRRQCWFTKFSCKIDRRTQAPTSPNHCLCKATTGAQRGRADNDSHGTRCDLVRRSPIPETIIGSSGGGVYSRWRGRWMGLVVVAQGSGHGEFIPCDVVLAAWEDRANPAPPD